MMLPESLIRSRSVPSRSGKYEAIVAPALARAKTGPVPELSRQFSLWQWMPPYEVRRRQPRPLVGAAEEQLVPLGREVLRYRQPRKRPLSTHLLRHQPAV